ncbi:MAG: glycosyltransferase family 1 protein [Sulfuricella sp.]|nr:glycosyltransferase family 1 protein [Sulfuricella sp.]
MKTLPSLLKNTGHSRNPLRIAVICETWPPEINGVALTMERMVQGLVERGHAVQLIRPCQGAQDCAAAREGFHELLLPGFSIPRYPELRFGMPSFGALKKAWAENRPDLVHIATEGPLGWAALRTALKLDIPVTTDFHTNFHNYTEHYGIGWLEGPIGWYLRRFHNQARYTFVPSEGLRADMEARHYRNLAVIGRGIDTRLFNPQRRNPALRQQWHAHGDEPVAIYVGRLAAEKNLGLVARSFEVLRIFQPHARMVWVGDGPERAGLQALYPEHTFAGMKTGEELAEHYASADIFLFPSMTETFGNVTLEALASGLAVVAYRYAAAAEYIRHEGNGLTAHFDDEAEFCNQVAHLGAEPEFARTLGKNARLGMESLGWDAVCEQFEHFLYHAVQQGGRHAREDRLLFMPD